MIRRELWEELTTINDLCDGPWVACGDFNVTGYTVERTDNHILSGEMSEFTDWIKEMELFDPPLCGGSFTWSQRGAGGGGGRPHNSFKNRQVPIF